MTTYFGNKIIAGITTNFKIETSETLTQIVIDEGVSESDSFSDGVLTLTLDETDSYNDNDVQTLLNSATVVDSAEVSGQSYQVESTAWLGGIDMSETETVKAQWALGTHLMRQDNEGDYHKIAKLKEISGPEFSLDFEDTTDHDSPGGWEEIIPTILRSGEVGLDLNFIPTNQSQLNLIKDMLNRVNRKFKLRFPDEAQTEWFFNAYVIGFESGAPTEDALNASVTIKITGEPVLANVND